MFVDLVSITFSLMNFFKILINLTAQVSPQVIDEKILMMDLNLNNYLSTVIQLRQDVYTGIKILHRVGHGRQDMNVTSLQNSHIFGWQVQHIADKLTSDFWVAENFLSNQVIGRANSQMSENHPFPPSIVN
ncbi:hypothetical protein SPAR72_0076 [Streptococcus pneumoniae GA41538]|nr:hypothetical protein SPAR72_0076 [Streptococcus pneumoniae GA41538]EJG95292.1 hypothetical protein SPAR151_0043 [Streptococcus pneumoniae GA04216]